GFVPDDPVTRVDLLATAIDFAPDLPEAFRFPGVWRHVTAEAREVEVQDRDEVPHGAVDHDAGHALHEARVARQFAPDGGRSAAVYFLNEPLGIALSPCIAFLIVRVASATFSALMIAPPTITIDAPAATACATVSEFRPPATATGSAVADATAFNSWRGVWAI